MYKINGNKPSRMCMLCDQFICLRRPPGGRPISCLPTVTAQAQNAVLRILALPTNAGMLSLINDYY